MSSPEKPKLVIPAGALKHIIPAGAKKSTVLASSPDPFVGIQVNPLGNRSNAGVGYAGWEWWPGTAGSGGPSGQFSNLSPDATQSGGTITAYLNQSNANIGTSGATPNTSPSYARGGRLTSGGFDGGYQFSLAAQASFAISKVTLQIKHSNFLWGENFVGLNYVENNPPLDMEDGSQIPFSASLNSTVKTGAPYYNDATKNAGNTYARGSWDPSDGSNTGQGGTTTFYFVFQYAWTGLSIAANTPFTIDFYSLEDEIGQGFSVDTVTVDVATS